LSTRNLNKQNNFSLTADINNINRNKEGKQHG